MIEKISTNSNVQPLGYMRVRNDKRTDYMINIKIQFLNGINQFCLIFPLGITTLNQIYEIYEINRVN